MLCNVRARGAIANYANQGGCTDTTKNAEVQFHKSLDYAIVSVLN
jgi:hypothetical protein